MVSPPYSMHGSCLLEFPRTQSITIRFSCICKLCTDCACTTLSDAKPPRLCPSSIQTPCVSIPADRLSWRARYMKGPGSLTAPTALSSETPTSLPPTSILDSAAVHLSSQSDIEADVILCIHRPLLCIGSISSRHRRSC